MMLSDYTAGTISVAADGTAVTGVGTAWEVARFREGDWLIANGWVNVVASVDSNTSLTLAQPWRGGELSGASYRLRYMSDGSRASAQARQLIDMLGGSGNLEALGGLIGAPGSIPYFTGAGTMGLLSPQDITQGVRYDVQVDELSDRDAYDGEPEGFAVLISDVGDGRSALYSRVGAAGTWSDPAYITGPVGPANTLAKGTVTTGAPGTDADISITGDAPNQTLNLTIPRGDVGPPNTLIKGTVTTGPAGSDADISITGEAPVQTLNITIPRGDKGEGLQFDASVDELADRDEYDNEPQGFTVLVRDIGNGRAAIFEKESAATADWSAPAYITGASGGGDVVGPESATDGNIAVFDGVTGKLLKDGGQPIASLLPRDGSAAMTGPLVLTEDDAPGTPDAGQVALYAKSDGKLYRKDDTGAEEEVGAGVGGVGPVFDTLAEAAAFSPTIAPPWINTRGHASAGDGGGAEYKHVGSSAPAHAGAFAITLADGVTSIWYELSTSPVSPFMLGAKGDGVTNDSVAFDALRVLLPRGEVDLEGKTFMVDAIPAGAYRNGYFKIPSFEGDLSALIPARDTLRTARTALTTGSCYAAWCQDTWAVHRGVVYAMWNEGADHANSAMNGVSMRLKNGVWTQKESVLRDLTEAHWVSAAAIVDGVQMVCRRDNSDNDYRLYMRHLSERFEFTDILNAGGSPGTKAFYIYLSDVPAASGMIGAREGMTAVFNSVDTIGGQGISGAYTMSFINGTRIQWAHPNDFSGETLLAGGEFSISFEETDWIECNIDGKSIAAAIDAKWVSYGGSTSTFNLHSMAAVSADAGTFYVGVSGGDLNVAIARIFRPWDTNSQATVSWVREITGADAEHSEPTLWRDPANGYLYGFCRTQSFSVPPIFWWSDDDLASAPTVTSAPGNGYAVQSPIPIVGVGDMLYGLASGSRNGTSGIVGTAPATIPIYLLRATKADAEANGFAAFEWILVDTVQFENQYFAAANAVGVGSIEAIDESTLIAGYGGELPGATTPSGLTSSSSAQIYALKIDISQNGALGRGRLGPDRVHNPIDLYWLFTGLSAIADGGYLTFIAERLGIGPSCYNTSDGYFTPPETGLYEFSGQVTYEDGNAGEKYCRLVDSSGTDVLGGLFFALDSNIGLAGNETHGVFNFAVSLREGQRVRIQVTAASGTRSSSQRSYLYIKKLS